MRVYKTVVEGCTLYVPVADRKWLESGRVLEDVPEHVTPLKLGEIQVLRPALHLASQILALKTDSDNLEIPAPSGEHPFLEPQYAHKPVPDYDAVSALVSQHVTTYTLPTAVAKEAAFNFLKKYQGAPAC